MKIRLEIEGKNAGSINYKGADSIDLAVAYLYSIEADEVQVRIQQKITENEADAEFEGEFPLISATKFIISVAGAKYTTCPSQPTITSSINGNRDTVYKREIGDVPAI